MAVTCTALHSRTTEIFPVRVRFSSFLGLLTCAAVLAALAGCDGATTAGPDAALGDGLFDRDPEWASATASFWRWFPDEGMRCRDSSATGYGLRRELDSRDLLIVLQTGGACFDSTSCATNDARYNAASFNTFKRGKGTRGIYADSASNPFRGWNTIMVPYCTGDVHGGDTTSVEVPGVPGTHQFVGYRNLDAMLQRIAWQARNATRVVVAGGGFAVTLTYGLTAERLAPAPVHFLADAGPIPPGDSVLTPALQQRWRDLWDLDAALPDGCTDCSQPDGDGLEHILPYYASTYPDRYFGLVSHMDDPKNRAIFGVDNTNCVVSGDGSCRVPLDDFTDGLYGIRSMLGGSPNAGTFYVPERGHVSFTVEDKFYEMAIDSLYMTQWIKDLIDGAVVNAGP